MPTTPLESILSRDLSIVMGGQIIKDASTVLQEVVNYSTNAFARCATSNSDNEEDISILLSYLHIIELTDSIEVLLAHSCPTPAQLLLRSSFESLLSIEYILEEQYSHRALSWLAFFMRKKVSVYKSYDPSTPEGKQLRKEMSSDKISHDVKITYPPKFDEFIQNYKERLNSPKYKQVQDEIDKYKREHNHPPKQWYQLFGPPPPQKTPRNIEELAKYLRRGGWYEILYREWSSIIHAVSPSRFITTTDKGTLAIRRLRNPSQVSEVASFAIHFLFDATRLVLGKFRPGEEKSLATWYKRDVQKLYNKLTYSCQPTTDKISI